MPAEPDLNKQAEAETACEIPRAAVLAALDEVVASAIFGRAERPARFLRHLVETALRGDRHLLKESVLGTDVFGRPPTWDPRLDPVVRQEAARLRKRLANYYESSGAGAEIRIELPVGGYVPVFRRTAMAHGTAIPPSVDVPARRRRLWPYAAAGLLCAAAAVLIWRASHSVSPASIAVLPFTNLTADPANQYFADGLTDEITDSLSRFKTLRVIARSSASQFRGKNVREVGRALNVGSVVEGSVERSGDRIRVIAHLERASDGSLLWSNTYERRTADLFAVQSELAAGIAGSLKASAGAPPAKHVPNGEAHDWVLKARYDLQQLTTEALMRVEAEYQHAIDLDPQYAAAYLGLGTAKYDQFAARGSVFQTEAERRTAEQLIHRALELDPDLPAGHSMLALLAMQYDWNWGGAERELQTAAAGAPDATVESTYTLFLIYRGRFAEADQHIRRMADLDPFSTTTMNNVGLAKYLEGRFAEAREVAQRMAAQAPKMISPPQMIGMTYVAEGHPELALPIFRQLKQRFPPGQIFEALAYAAGGQRNEALRLIRPYEEKYPNAGVPMQWFAMVYANMGDEPNTVKWLQRSADRHEFQVLNIAIHPAYERFRSSPEFRALEKRVGLEQ